MRAKRPARRALDDLDQDIRDHLTRETEEHIARGLSPEEARRQALLRFGNVALTMEDTRAVWVGPWLDELRQDLRYAFRTLRKNPGFTTIVILTLALGIGVNTAIFSLFNAIMLRTLPIQAPEALQFVAHGTGDRVGPGSNYPYFERIEARTDLFEGATTYLRKGLKVSAGDGVESARGQFAGGRYHAVVGVPIVLGRGFMADGDRGGADPHVAVISDGYWARKFGRDPRVVGRTLVIDGESIAIIGVTAPGFEGLDPGSRVDITLPLALRAIKTPDVLTDHGTWMGDMPIVVRLKPGVTSAQAASAVDTIFQHYIAEPENAWLTKMPGWTQVRAALLPANRGTGGLRAQYAGSLQVLLAMVAVVLLIGCANVANLLVARGRARAKEVAVRLSIGASRRRLVRQFLTESLLLALMGGAGGFALAQMGVAAIAAMVGGGPNPIVLDLRPDAGVLLFTIIVSLLTGVLFGLAPALGATRVNLTPALKTAGAGAATPRTSGGRWPARQVLVGLQIALCVLLVAGAGLLTQTLRNLQMRDGGFDRGRVLLFSLDAGGTALKPERLPALCEALLDRLTSRGDVLSGSCSRNIPVNTRGNARPLDVPGAPPQPQNARLVFTNMVTPGYFRTLGIDILNGRVFDAHDSATAERVAVINRATARFFFGSDNPIGRQVHFFSDDAHRMTVVGIVEDTIQRSLRDDPPRIVYTPLAQLIEPEPLLTVALRTRADPMTLAAAVRPDVRALDGAVVIDYIRTMDQQIGETLVRERLLAMLSGAFGILALVLSCVGLYGVVSYDVTRDLRDLGIRFALGAQRGDVLRQVVGRALSVSSLGVIAGIAAALAATQLLSSLLFGVTARDPVILTAAAALLLLTTLIASYLPARRAARVDPVVVLRAE
jgi:predicted permease